MKHFKYTLMLITAIIALSSCELNAPLSKLIDDKEFVSPNLVSHNDVVINGDNVKKENVVFNWSNASFGQNVQIEYKLYATMNTDTTLVGTSFTNSLTISKQDFNGLVCNELHALKNTTVKIGTFLIASVYQTDIKSIKSSSISYNVTTYAAPLRSVFMPGRYQNWNIDLANEFWETDGGTNIYSTLVNLDPSKYDANGDDGDYANFKVTSARNWSSGNWGKNEITQNWSGFDAGNGNLTINIKTEGTTIFILSFNKGKMTMDKTNVKSVTLIGSFDECGWSEDKEIPFVYDPVGNVWQTSVVTFSGDNVGFLMRLNKSWDTKYGDSTIPSSDIDKGVLLKKGGSDIKVPSAGKYIMKLYGNRTPFVLVMDKQ